MKPLRVLLPWVAACALLYYTDHHDWLTFIVALGLGMSIGHETEKGKMETTGLAWLGLFLLLAFGLWAGRLFD